MVILLNYVLNCNQFFFFIYLFNPFFVLLKASFFGFLVLDLYKYAFLSVLFFPFVVFVEKLETCFSLFFFCTNERFQM